MQRWLPGLNSVFATPGVVAMLIAIALSSHNIADAENALKWIRPGGTRPASTLDAQLPSQRPIGSDIHEAVVKGIFPTTVHSASPHSNATQQSTSTAQTQANSVSKPKRTRPTSPSPFGKWLEMVEEDHTNASSESENLASSPSSSGQAAASERIALRSVRRSRRNPPNTDARRSAVRNSQETTSAAIASDNLGGPAPESYPTPDSDPTADENVQTPNNLPPLTKSQLALRTKIRRVLTDYYNRPLNTRDRSPWELMHAMLSFEVNSKVLRDGPQGEPITAVGWLCFNQPCKRRSLMYVKDDGELSVRVGPALQGHRGQLLALLAQAKVQSDYPMRVEGHDFTIADLIEMEKKTCYPRSELTFKLIGLMHYLDSDAQWVNDQGMAWDIQKLISEELRQPVRGAACGGTHRLSGLTLAYKKRQQRGEPVDGQYLKAHRFVARYQQYAYRLQNRDGSFSTEWFRGPGNEESVDRKLKTTGHILEWLLYAATEKELKSRNTMRAANYLANIMVSNRSKDWEAGPLGHAIHALLLYDRLVFSPYDEPGMSPIANKPKARSARRSAR